MRQTSHMARIHHPVTGTQQEHRVQIFLNGLSVDAPSIRHSPQPHQSALRGAKEKYGSALCGCQVQKLPLVIRERLGKYFLAAWPDQAAKHALDCPFYSEHVASRSGYTATAIKQEDDTTHVLLKHQFRQENHRLVLHAKSLTKPATPKMQESSHALVEPKSTLQGWGLLHYLWEEAGLNRWYPGWHRDWGMVRYLLRRVAQNTLVNERPLLESLYIPPIWRANKKTEINAWWQDFCAPLLKQNQGSSTVATGLVIGTVRSLEATEFGNVICLHHHASRFYVNRRTSDTTAYLSRRGWAAAKKLEATPDSQTPGVVAAMRVQASSAGNLNVVELILMRVSPRYIPVNGPYEDRLVHQLIDEDRQFTKPLHYDHPTMELPNFVLKDIEGHTGAGLPVDAAALFIYGPSMTLLQRMDMEARDRKHAQESGIGYWQWIVSNQSEPTALPKSRLQASETENKTHATKKI